MLFCVCLLEMRKASFSQTRGFFPARLLIKLCINEPFNPLDEIKNGVNFFIPVLELFIDSSLFNIGTYWFILHVAACGVASSRRDRSKQLYYTDVYNVFI